METQIKENKSDKISKLKESDFSVTKFEVRLSDSELHVSGNRLHPHYTAPTAYLTSQATEKRATAQSASL